MSLVLREIAGTPLTAAQRDGNWAVEVTEASHTKTVGTIVYPTSGTAWGLAQGNAESTAGRGIVAFVPDVNTFWVVMLAGSIVTVTAHGLGGTGTIGWLSQSVAGSLTATAPTGGGIKQALVIVFDANSLIWTPSAYEVI